MKLKLTIELVPKSSWFNNVRSAVPRPYWDLLRKDCYKKAGHVCEICTDSGLKQGYKWPVECHEIWEYDDALLTQTLTGLISLCPICHKVKHAGRTIFAENDYKLVLNQLMKVNQMSQNEADEYIEMSFKQWSDRSEHKWTVNTSWLDSVSTKNIK